MEKTSPKQLYKNVQQEAILMDKLLKVFLVLSKRVQDGMTTVESRKIYCCRCLKRSGIKFLMQDLKCE